MRYSNLALVVAFFLVLFDFNVSFAQISLGSAQRASKSAAGTSPDAGSGSPVQPLNGQFIVFHSQASNLVRNDTNSSQDVFQRIISGLGVDGPATRLSVSTSGAQADGSSSGPAVSFVAPSGFYAVAFQTQATNLASFSDTKGNQDIYLRLPTLSCTVPVSLTPQGAFPNDDSSSPAVTIIPEFPVPGSNRVLVTFASDASDLVNDDTNNKRDVFLATLDIDSTCSVSRTLIRVAPSNTQPNNDSDLPQINGSGSVIVFSSTATNLASGSVANSQVYSYSVASGAITLLSQASGVAGNGDSYAPSISFNGRFAAFLSEADSLVSGASSSSVRVVRVDLSNSNLGSAIFSTVDGNSPDGSASGIVISPSGRFASFTDTSSNLVSNDNNNLADVFVSDFDTQSTVRISATSSGQDANGASRNGFFVPIGFTSTSAAITFFSNANNIVTGSSSIGEIFSTDAAYSAGIFTRSTILEVPPDITQTGSTVTIVPESFSAIDIGSSKRKSSLFRYDRKPSPQAAKRMRVQYDVRAKTETGKKKDNRKRLSRNPQATIRRLPPGTYTVNYRVQIKRGKRTVSRSDFSPPQRVRVQ